MYPTLPIGPLRVQTYGLFLLAGFMAGLWLAARAAQRRGLSGDHVYNLGFYALLAGIVTARLGHAVAYWEVYRTDPRQILSLSPGALLPAAGLLGAVLVAAVYLRRYRLPTLATLDSLALGTLLLLTIASVGAFVAGRSPGAPSAAPWAITVFGVRRHPVMAYEAAVLALLLIGLIWREARRPAPAGRIALLATFGYAAMRLFLEPLHAESVLVPGGWRLAQVVAWVGMIATGWLLALAPVPAAANKNAEL